MTGVDQAEKTVKYDQYWRKDVAYKFIDLTQGKFIDGCRDRYGNEMKLCVFRPLLCTLLRLNWAKQTPGRDWYGNVSSVEDNPTDSMNHCLCSPNS